MDCLPAEPPGEPKNTGVSSLSLVQEYFLTQESNRGLLHCRQILYQLSYQGSPEYKRQSIMACMCIMVNHTWDSELLNHQRKDEDCYLQNYCWARNKSQEKQPHICFQDEKKQLQWVLRKGPWHDILTELLSHSPTRRASLLSSEISRDDPVRLFRYLSPWLSPAPRSAPSECGIRISSKSFLLNIPQSLVHYSGQIFYF